MILAQLLATLVNHGLVISLLNKFLIPGKCDSICYFYGISIQQLKIHVIGISGSYSQM